MVKLSYSKDVLNVDICMKLYQIEYNKQYRIEDPLLNPNEALARFESQIVLDFGAYLDSK